MAVDPKCTIVFVNDKPVNYFGQPKITSQLGRSTSFSWQDYNVQSLHLPYSNVKVIADEQQEFIGVLLDKEIEYKNGIRLVTYTAMDYYRYLRKQALRGLKKGTLLEVVENAVREADSHHFLTPIQWLTTNSLDEQVGSPTFGEMINTKNLQVQTRLVASHLEDLLKEVCSQAKCEFDIDTATGQLMIIQRNSLGQFLSAPFNIIQGVNLDTCAKNPQDAYDGVKFKETAHKFSGVLVLGHRAEFLPDYITDYESLLSKPSSITYDIWSMAKRKHYDCLPDMDVITQIEATANAGCSILTIDPTSASFDKDGGSGSFQVFTASGCEWTATSNKSWVTITGGASGDGNGTVNYDVGVNPFNAGRFAEILVQGSVSQQVHTVSQGADPEGEPFGCDAVFFELTSSILDGTTSPNGSVDSGLFTPPRPKSFVAESAVTGLSTPRLDPFSFYRNDSYVLSVDLTNEGLIGDTVLMHYRLNIFGVSFGANTPPSSGFPAGWLHDGAAYYARLQLLVNGSLTKEIEVEHDGGQQGLVQEALLLVSGFLLPIYSGFDPPINLTPFIGTVVEITLNLEVTLSASTGTNPFVSPIEGAGCGCSLQLVC